MTSESELPSSPPAGVEASPAGFLRRHAAKFVVSLLVTVGLLYTLRKGGLKFVPEGGDFGNVHGWVVAVYFLFIAAYTWFRSVRWRFLLRSIADVPKMRLFHVSCIGFAAILLLPLRIGEIVRPYLVRTRPTERAALTRPITLTAATSSIVAERVIDGLYVSIVLALALIFVPTVHPLPDRVVALPITVARVRQSGYLMLGLFCALFAAIAVFYFARSWAHRATLLVVGKVSRPLAERLAGLLEKAADGLHVFGRASDAFGFFLETTIYWGLNVLGMWMLAWGCGVVHADGSAITFGESCAIMGLLSCAILIPGPPGLLGPFQVGVYAAMTMYFPTHIVIGSGAAYVFLMYVSQVVFQLLIGAWSLFMEGGKRGFRGGLQALEEAEGIVPEHADAS